MSSNIKHRTLSNKLVIIGDANVGKTCLITRFHSNTFGVTQPTIGAIHYIKSINNVQLDIWDTAGQERFKSMIPMYYKGARGIIICFDITNKDSFEGAKNWFDEIENSVKKAIIVLCGTKKDLEENRIVDYKIAQNYSNEKGIKYFETSSKDHLYIEELFNYFAQEIHIENIKKEMEGIDLNSFPHKQELKKEKFFKLKNKCC